jgi:hypothetical protein
MSHSIVFRTSFVWEIDLAKDALRTAGISHFMREETFSGYNEAFSASPTAGPGLTFCLLVPTSEQERAKEILRELSLDVDNQPGYWDFNSHPRVRVGFKVWAWGGLTIIALLTILEILRNLHMR